jgi:hypothetical protein
MYKATARSGPDASSVGALANPMLCSQHFILAYDTLSERAGYTLSSTSNEAVVRGTWQL